MTLQIQAPIEARHGSLAIKHRRSALYRRPANAETYLDEAVTNILGQPCRDFRFIIINHSSTKVQLVRDETMDLFAPHANDQPAQTFSKLIISLDERSCLGADAQRILPRFAAAFDDRENCGT